MRRIAILLLLAVAFLPSCEHSDRHNSRRLVYEVEASDGVRGGWGYSGDGSTYNIFADSSAFLKQNGEQAADSSLAPSNLIIKINLLGELVSSLTDNPNGFHVNTQFQLEGGTINIDHTNQAKLVISPAGDSLYAVRGEGIVSRGSELFENISGFFYEESTYKISRSPSGQGSGSGLPQVERINCRYELVVDF